MTYAQKVALKTFLIFEQIGLYWTDLESAQSDIKMCWIWNI